MIIKNKNIPLVNLTKCNGFCTKLFVCDLLAYQYLDDWFYFINDMKTTNKAHVSDSFSSIRGGVLDCFFSKNVKGRITQSRKMMQKLKFLFNS